LSCSTPLNERQDAITTPVPGNPNHTPSPRHYIEKKFKSSKGSFTCEAVSREHYNYFKASLLALEGRDKWDLEKAACQHFVNLLKQIWQIDESAAVLPWDNNSNIKAITPDHLPTPTSLRVYFD